MRTEFSVYGITAEIGIWLIILKSTHNRLYMRGFYYK